MGTLFNQSERIHFSLDKEDVINEILYNFKDIQKKTGLTYNQVIETCKLLELRRKNKLYIKNADAHDEQMAGFGELFKIFNDIFYEHN